MNVWMVECNNLTLNNLILAFAIRYPVAYLLYGEIVACDHCDVRYCPVIF